MSKALEAAAYAIRHAAYVFNDEEDGPYLDNPEECARAAISAYLKALAEDEELPDALLLRHVNTYYRETIGSIMGDACVKAADFLDALKESAP